MIKRSIGAIVVVAATAMSGSSAQALRPVNGARLFETIAGTWSGVGTVTLARGAEPLRCRAVYGPASPERLHLDLRCQGTSFALQVQSDILREGDRVTGQWTETTFGIPGDLSGSVAGGAIRVTVEALGVSAQLSLALRGNTQAVTLTSQSALASSATVTLRRG